MADALSQTPLSLPVVCRAPSWMKNVPTVSAFVKETVWPACEAQTARIDPPGQD